MISGTLVTKMKNIIYLVGNKKYWFIFFVSLVFFAIIHQIRTDFREHLYGKYSDNSAHTITSTQIWFNEKPWNVKFSSILSFKSVQYKNLNPEVHERHIGGLTFPIAIGEHLREVYISYPTGYLVPLYLFSIAQNKQPDQKSLFLLNSLNSTLIFFLLLAILNKVKDARNNVNLPIYVVTVSLLSIGYIYFYQIFLSYNSLGVLYLLAFMLCRAAHYRKFSYVVLFAGLLTDYLIFYVVIFQIIYNLIEQKKLCGDTVRITILSIFAFCIYMWQLSALGVLEQLWWKLKFRTGLSETIANGKYVEDLSELEFYKFILFYGFNVVKVVGPATLLIPWIIFKYYKKLNKTEKYLILVSFIPSFAYTVVFKSSSIHEYEALKFIPLAVICFMIWVRNSRNQFVILTFLLVSNVGNIVYWLPQYKINEFQDRDQLNQSIQTATTSSDLLFFVEDKVKIWENSLTFNISPYLWWRDYPRRQRNLNRVSSVAETIGRINDFAVSPERCLLIVNKDDAKEFSAITNIDFKELNDTYVIKDILPKYCLSKNY